MKCLHCDIVDLRSELAASAAQDRAAEADAEKPIYAGSVH